MLGDLDLLFVFDLTTGNGMGFGVDEFSDVCSEVIVDLPTLFDDPGCLSNFKLDLEGDCDC